MKHVTVNIEFDPSGAGGGCARATRLPLPSPTIPSGEQGKQMAELIVKALNQATFIKP